MAIGSDSFFGIKSIEIFSSRYHPPFCSISQVTPPPHFLPLHSSLLSLEIINWSSVIPSSKRTIVILYRNPSLFMIPVRSFHRIFSILIFLSIHFYSNVRRYSFDRSTMTIGKKPKSFLIDHPKITKSPNRRTMMFSPRWWWVQHRVVSIRWRVNCQHHWKVPDIFFHLLVHPVFEIFPDQWKSPDSFSFVVVVVFSSFPNKTKTWRKKKRARKLSINVDIHSNEKSLMHHGSRR